MKYNVNRRNFGLGFSSTAMVLLALVLTPTPCVSAEPERNRALKVRLITEYTDNSRQEADPLGVEEFEISPALDLKYAYDNSKVNANLKYTFEHKKYSKKTLDDRSDVLGGGEARFTLVGQSLFWTAYHNRSRLRIDSQKANAQANQTERQLFQTGPALRLNFEGDRTLDFNLSYIDSSFSRDVTNESKQGRFEFDYRQPLNVNSSIGVSGMYSDVSSVIASQNYQSSRLGVNYDTSGLNMNLSMSLGANEIAKETGISFAGLFLSFSSAFQTEGAKWRFSLNRELTDSSIGLGLANNLLEEFSFGARDSDFNNNDIVERTRIEASYSKDLVPGRWAFVASLFGDQQDYQTLLLDKRALGAELKFKYFSTRQLRFEYRVSWGDDITDEPNNFTQRSTEIFHRLECWYKLNRRLDFVFKIGKNRKFLASHLRDHDEFVTGISLEYKI